MKKQIILIATALFCVLGSFAQDWEKFALKGKVLSSKVSSPSGDVDSKCEFTPEGVVTSLYTVGTK